MARGKRGAKPKTDAYSQKQMWIDWHRNRKTLKEIAAKWEISIPTVRKAIATHQAVRDHNAAT
jgi:hypothetical protein